MDAKQDPERKFVERAPNVAVHAGLFATDKKEFCEVSDDNREECAQRHRGEGEC
jgi:hypothetical protein